MPTVAAMSMIVTPSARSKIIRPRLTNPARMFVARCHAWSVWRSASVRRIVREVGRPRAIRRPSVRGGRGEHTLHAVASGEARALCACTTSAPPLCQRVSACAVKVGACRDKDNCLPQRAKLPSSSKGRNTATMFLIYHNDNSLFHAITSVKCILTVCQSYTGLLTQIKVAWTLACFPLHASHRAVWRCEHARVSPPARGGGTAHVPGGVARGSACCPAALPRYQAGSLPPASQTSS